MAAPVLPPELGTAAHRAAVHVALGDEHCAVREFDAAIEEYTRAIELKSDFAEAYNNRAYATVCKHDESGQPLEDLNRALELRPNFPHAYNTRGCVHLARGNVGQAIADFTRAIELKADYPRALNNRANAYLRQGEFRLAFADLERAGRRPKRVLLWLFGVVVLVVGLTVAAAFGLRRSREERAN
jgi:tetratricopeptide (TPR) repeat protein